MYDLGDCIVLPVIGLAKKRLDREFEFERKYFLNFNMEMLQFEINIIQHGLNE